MTYQEYRNEQKAREYVRGMLKAASYMDQGTGLTIEPRPVDKSTRIQQMLQRGNTDLSKWMHEAEMKKTANGTPNAAAPSWRERIAGNINPDKVGQTVYDAGQAAQDMITDSADWVGRNPGKFSAGLIGWLLGRRIGRGKKGRGGMLHGLMGGALGATAGVLGYNALNNWLGAKDLSVSGISNRAHGWAQTLQNKIRGNM